MKNANLIWHNGKKLFSTVPESDPASIALVSARAAINKSNGPGRAG